MRLGINIHRYKRRRGRRCRLRSTLLVFAGQIPTNSFDHFFISSSLGSENVMSAFFRPSWWSWSSSFILIVAPKGMLFGSTTWTSICLTPSFVNVRWVLIKLVKTGTYELLALSISMYGSNMVMADWWVKAPIVTRTYSLSSISRPVNLIG